MPPKEYGRVCHRYIGKVTKFGLFRIIIFRSNCHFSVGGAENAPPPTGVGLTQQIKQIKKPVCVNAGQNEEEARSFGSTRLKSSKSENDSSFIFLDNL